MKNEFNENGGPRAHHYILKLSLHAGSDRVENPGDRDKPAFQQALLFMEKLKKWAASLGQSDSLKCEALPLADDGCPRLRLACPPALMAQIEGHFAPKIRRVDEIPLPPAPDNRPVWKRIFGL